MGIKPQHITEQQAKEICLEVLTEEQIKMARDGYRDFARSEYRDKYLDILHELDRLGIKSVASQYVMSKTAQVWKKWFPVYSKTTGNHEWKNPFELAKDIALNKCHKANLDILREFVNEFLLNEEKE
jgi:hypothetical protein